MLTTDDNQIPMISSVHLYVERQKVKKHNIERHIMKYKVQKHRKLKSGMIDNSITEDILM